MFRTNRKFIQKNEAYFQNTIFTPTLCICKISYGRQHTQFSLPYVKVTDIAVANDVAVSLFACLLCSYTSLAVIRYFNSVCQILTHVCRDWSTLEKKEHPSRRKLLLFFSGEHLFNGMAIVQPLSRYILLFFLMSVF